MRTLPIRTLMSSLSVAVALAAAAPAAIAQAPRQDQASQNRFCMIIGNEGQPRCTWQSLAQCERATRREGGRCFDRSYMLAATTPPADTTAAPERPLAHRHVVRHRKPLR